METATLPSARLCRHTTLILIWLDAQSVIPGNKSKGTRHFSITCTAFIQDTWQVNIWKGRTRNRDSKLFEFPPCSMGSWSDLFELQPIDHTSPSWLALLAPCHILVGLRNSLFLFELIRTKKDFLPRPWERQRGRNVDMKQQGCTFPSLSAGPAAYILPWMRSPGGGVISTISLLLLPKSIALG